MTQPPIHIRPMQPGEKPAVRRVMRQLFPPIQQWFFTFTPHVLVAAGDGDLLGAVVFKVFTLPGKRRGGLVDWVFTAPQARGLGVGRRLVEAALDFQEQACDQVMACVEGYNTSSGNIFAGRRFSILSPGEQFRRYGWGVLAVWAVTFHCLDIGHFVWARPGASRPDSPALQWWGSVLANALVFLLALWRESGFGRVDPITLAAAPLAVLLFFGLRQVAMLLAARTQNLEVRYRAWESGFPLSVVVALLSGGLFPMLGNVYPASDRWRYRDLLPRLGVIALAGVLPALVLAWGMWAYARVGSPPAGVTAWLDVAFRVARPLVLFDVAAAFFPFVSFNGRRLWDWKRGLWAVLAVTAVVIFCLIV